MSHVRVAYQLEKACNKINSKEHCENNGYRDVRFVGSTENRHAREPSDETCCKRQPHTVKLDGPLEKNYVRADPSYLQTLGQAHSGWIFGAIAELIDNSRDAKANR